MSLVKITLLIVSFLTLLINVYIISFYSLFESRIIRVITVIAFLVLFFIFKGFKNKTILISLLCFLLSDVFMIFYENTLSNKLTFVLSIIGYFNLVVYLFRNKHLKKVNNYFLVLILILITLNVFGLYQLIDAIAYKLHDGLQEVILYLYGLVIVSLCVFTANYNFSVNTKQSMYFMYFVFGFAFSDFCAVLAYYYNFQQLYYLDRFTYIFALFIMVKYAVKDFKKEEIPSYII